MVVIASRFDAVEAQLENAVFSALDADRAEFLHEFGAFTLGPFFLPLAHVIQQPASDR